MKVLEVTVKSIREGEEVVANFITEQRKGETWNRTKVVTVTSGTPEATRRLVLEDGDRLVIEGKTSKKVVYDREQNMSKIVDADDEVRARQEAAEAAQREANIAREEKQREVSEGLKAQAAAEQPKTNLGNPVPPQQSLVTPAQPNKLAETPPAKPGTTTPPAATGQGSPSAPKVAGDHGQGATGTKDGGDKK